eukprot:m.345202 g.345202  ORF g.345202 m.345202 type:complete len:351 (+) comp20657_c0_seq4:1090-2142(+)
MLPMRCSRTSMSCGSMNLTRMPKSARCCFIPSWLVAKFLWAPCSVSIKPTKHQNAVASSSTTDKMTPAMSLIPWTYPRSKLYMHHVHNIAPSASMLDPFSRKKSVSRSVRATSLATRSMRSRKAELLAICVVVTVFHCCFITSYSARLARQNSAGLTCGGGVYPSRYCHTSFLTSGATPPSKIAFRSSAPRVTRPSPSVHAWYTAAVTGGPRTQWGRGTSDPTVSMTAKSPRSPSCCCSRTASVLPEMVLDPSVASPGVGERDMATPASLLSPLFASPAAPLALAPLEERNASGNNRDICMNWSLSFACVASFVVNVDTAWRKKRVTVDAPSSSFQPTSSVKSLTSFSGA